MSSGTSKLLLSILFFPVLFQADFLSFAWGGDDPIYLAILKRIFLVLPVLGFILGCWVTMAGLLSVLIRHERIRFLNAMIVTWWEFGRSVFLLWGGVFKFGMVFVVSLLQLLKLVIVTPWYILYDLILAPLNVVRNIGTTMVNPSVPWIAVSLTFFWSIVEAGVFTYVTSPLVIDTLSNLTGDELSEAIIRIPLFFFMLLIVLGSYAVLSTWATAVREKDVPSIIKIGIIELIVMFVEIVFLYREFVDSLVPWFAQHAGEGFELGIVAMLSISTLAWLGIRSISWFLFAAHGTPTIMAVIQGTGIRTGQSSSPQSPKVQSGPHLFLQQIRSEMSWGAVKGDELIAAFLLPPLQVVGACINFCTLLISNQHLFSLPFNNLSEIMTSHATLKDIGEPTGNNREKSH